MLSSELHLFLLWWLWLEWWHIRASAVNCKQGFQGPLLHKRNRKAHCCSRANGNSKQKVGFCCREGYGAGLMGETTIHYHKHVTWWESKCGFQLLLQRRNPPTPSTSYLSLCGHIIFFYLDTKDLEWLFRLLNVSELVQRNGLGCQAYGNPRYVPRTDQLYRTCAVNSVLPKPRWPPCGCAA